MQLLKNVQKNLLADIKAIVNALQLEYTITNKSDYSKIITSEELIHFITNLYQIDNKYCTAMTNSGYKCTMKPYLNSKYCKKHITSAFSYISSSNTQLNIQENSISYLDSESDNNKLVNDVVLQKKLIDDSFYYVDHKYIYDISSKQKVGYINTDNEYTLTSDPFILDNI